MKNFFIVMVLAAILVAGCKKNEDRQTQTIQSNTETGLSKELPRKSSSACCYSRFAHEDDSQCQNRVWKPVFCYMTVGCEEECTFSIDLTFNPIDSTIASIRIPAYQSLPNECANWLQSFINVGTITMEYDSPIDDPDILVNCSRDYIPAGTYSIYTENEDALIRLQ